MTTDLKNALAKALDRKYGSWDQADDIAAVFLDNLRPIMEMTGAPGKAGETGLQLYYEKNDRHRQWHLFIVKEAAREGAAPVVISPVPTEGFDCDYLRIAFFGPSGTLKVEAVAREKGGMHPATQYDGKISEISYPRVFEGIAEWIAAHTDIEFYKSFRGEAGKNPARSTQNLAPQ